MAKERIDILLCEKKICETRTRAAAYVLEGRVSVNGKVIAKPGEKIDVDSEIHFKNPEDEFVSRGAYKLLRAVERLGVSFEGRLCLDIGASTGGFTHLMLKNGARKVIAVDVGTSVMHPFIKNHPQVKAFERTHIKDFDLASAGESFVDTIVCDVSFISVLKFAERFEKFTSGEAEAVILIKPQFEAEANEVKKGGIVVDKKIHTRIILNFIASFAKIRFSFAGLTFAPRMKGTKNIEYLIFFKKNDKINRIGFNDAEEHERSVAGLINEAFLEFGFN